MKAFYWFTFLLFACFLLNVLLASLSLQLPLNKVISIYAVLGPIYLVAFAFTVRLLKKNNNATWLLLIIITIKMILARLTFKWLEASSAHHLSFKANYLVVYLLFLLIFVTILIREIKMQKY